MTYVHLTKQLGTSDCCKQSAFTGSFGRRLPNICLGLAFMIALFFSEATAQPREPVNVQEFVAGLNEDLSDNAKRKALWNAIVADIGRDFPGYKPYVLEASKGSKRIMAHGIFAAETRYTVLDFQAFHLPSLDGSTSESVPRFRVHRTNAWGENKRRIWYNGHGTRRVQSQGLRRVKILTDEDHIVVFVRREGGDKFEGSGNRQVGLCLPRPVNYEDWYSRCS